MFVSVCLLVSFNLFKACINQLVVFSNSPRGDAVDRKCSLSIHAVTWGFTSSASRTLAWTNQPEFSWVFKFVGGVKGNVFIVFVHISHFLPKYVDIKACMAYAHMFLDWFSLSSLTCNIHDSRLNQRCRVFFSLFLFLTFQRDHLCLVFSFLYSNAFYFLYYMIL